MHTISHWCLDELYCVIQGRGNVSWEGDKPRTWQLQWQLTGWSDDETICSDMVEQWSIYVLNQWEPVRVYSIIGAIAHTHTITYTYRQLLLVT